MDDNLAYLREIMGADNLLHFFLRALKDNLSEDDLTKFEGLRLLEKLETASGNMIIRKTDYGSKIYNALSALNNRGEIYSMDGKWYFAY